MFMIVMGMMVDDIDNDCYDDDDDDDNYNDCYDDGDGNSDDNCYREGDC